MLEDAKVAIEDISKAALTEIKSLANPPEVIKEVCSICFFLVVGGTDNSWKNIKTMVLGDS